jgi:ATP-binding cassette subfamily F protein 3
LKTILGTLRELDGKIMWGSKTDIGYYSQQLEELNERNEIIQELRTVAPLAENGALRGFLARFLFTGEDVFKRVSDLSGGEKGRLALAKLIYSNKNVLILDEPTNHLDIPSREALESALDAYEGTLVTVSHDRYFLDRVATQILAFEDDGRVEVFEGNYTEYHDHKIKTLKSRVQNQVESRNFAESVKQPKTENGKESNLSKNQLQRIEQRIKEIEKEIPKAGRKIRRTYTSIKQTGSCFKSGKTQRSYQKN